jgi:Undecaprenyl-phosphate glucose phosphotransferase
LLFDFFFEENKMVRNHQRFFNVMQITLDAFTLSLAYIVAILFKLQGNQANLSREPHFIGPFWMVPLILAAYYLMDAYSPMRSRSFRKEAIILTRAHAAGLFIIFSVQFFLKELHFSREVSLCFAGFGLLAMVLERFVVRVTLRHLRQQGHNCKHILIIGAGPLGVEFANKLEAQRDFGYAVVGFLDEDLNKGEEVLGKRVLGNCLVLPSLLETILIDEVVVALPITSHPQFGGIIDCCEKAGVRTRIIPDYYRFLPGTPHIEEFDGIPLLNVRRIRLDDPFHRSLKRAFDIAVSSTALLLTSPLMVGIAIAIKLTSPGPLVFHQNRVGLNNRPFGMLKFRSMRVDTAATASTTWTTANDPRKTKFGSFLRKTSLDELPQFFNVLFGDMSVIGPRPERPFFVEQFKEEIPKYMVKHQVKPGITGWAQVNGWRGDTSIMKRIECDIYYIENWELQFDIKIMFMTVFKGMVNRNAY